MNNPLISCVLKKDINAVTNILADDIHNITEKDMLEASLHAASVNAKNIIGVFLSKKIHINDMLATAVKYSFTSAIDVLLQMGGNVNHEYNTCTLLTQAAKQHNIKCMNNLLSQGAQLDYKTKKGETCLTTITRSSNDYTKEVEYLIEKGADVNLPNRRNETPLHKAAIYNNVPTLRSLLSAGAQVNYQDNTGTTALMMACRLFNSESVTLLLQHGANKDIQSLRKDTALMCCLIADFHPRQRKYMTIKLLLENGCNINLVDDYGETPLLLAIQQNEIPIVSELLISGANVLTENKEGLTPFVVSIYKKNDELATYFINMECYISGNLVRNQKWKRNRQIIAQMQSALSPVLNTHNCERLNQLFFGSGETFAIRRIPNPHIIAIMAMETRHKTLKTIVRHNIRTYLSRLSHINLITQITKLPLPTMLKHFLYFS